jgi:hypothetical protein
VKNLLILTVLFSSFYTTCLRADEKPLFAPRPTKDPMATKKHCQGAGKFGMIIDKPSGEGKGVYVLSSTNDVILDADVINTFLQWRFKPNTLSSLEIVVAFTADKDAAFYPVGVHPRNYGIPYPFKEAITPAKLWQGFSEFYGAAGHR